MTADHVHPKIRTTVESHVLAIEVKRYDGTHDGTPTLLTVTEALALISDLAGAIGRAGITLG